ncbi:hypothetical protein JB92DRAFT_1824297 [Gautieria morchelliformis]|nr:hypothetical protein JB92DRAFT_1824297 [Gautieria morchelliformis]
MSPLSLVFLLSTVPLSSTRHCTEVPCQTSDLNKPYDVDWMPFQKLSPDARRVRTIIISLPLIGVTSFVLYKRLVWGEPQRRLPGPDAHGPLVSVKTTIPNSVDRATKDGDNSKEPS